MDLLLAIIMYVYIYIYVKDIHIVYSGISVDIEWDI